MCRLVAVFEFWQFWAFFGFGRSRDQGGSLLWTRFTPSALVQRSADPSRTNFEPFWIYRGGSQAEHRVFYEGSGAWPGGVLRSDGG